MAVIGAVTLLFGGLLAFVQSDIKKVLAYSTVSQLGYMVMALGVGAWTAAIFHLFTHAIFKACLFLGSGSLAHHIHSFDMKKDMGGMRRRSCLRPTPRSWWAPLRSWASRSWPASGRRTRSSPVPSSSATAAIRSC